MKLRVARHTDRLAEVVGFYRDRVGLVEIGRFNASAFSFQYGVGREDRLPSTTETRQGLRILDVGVGWINAQGA
jgi:hypothetical protein